MNRQSNNTSLTAYKDVQPHQKKELGSLLRGPVSEPEQEENKLDHNQSNLRIVLKLISNLQRESAEQHSTLDL